MLITASGRSVWVPLKGAYQTGNLATAWTAIERLSQGGWIRRPDDAIEALSTVTWPGRFQVVSEGPLIVVDGAHNLHGIAGLRETLNMAPWRHIRWHLLFGVLADKPGAEMLEALLPSVEDVVLTEVPGDRGLDPTPLLSKLPADKMPRVERNLDGALREARARVRGPGEAILIAGSLSLLSHFNQQGLLQYAPPPRVDMWGEK